MALIQGTADYRIATYADAGLARVGQGAGIAIIAGDALRFVGIGANTCGRVAGSGDMALVTASMADFDREHARLLAYLAIAAA